MSVTLESYLRQRAERSAEPHRNFCYTCRRPHVGCYCPSVRPFESTPSFLILMHPHEVKKTIGTGRMASQCLSNSTLWVGADFATDPRVATLLADPSVYPVLLYPGPRSQNLSRMAPGERRAVFPSDGRQPVVIVLDATWNNAKKMLYHSPNLQKIPRIGFDTPHLSKFLLRKQPRDECFSSIEAIHHVLELLGDPGRDHLMEVFEGMVQKQLTYQKSQHRHSRHRINYFKRKGLEFEALP
ncbi:MAG TPA: tRNA-uridine aminocarboxypropyltransferase [Bdellovibrionota bacterium]|nr:tRNA-uridine aminocarboxypropyltransferase [Bdellovibrionota bacterium]